LAIPDFQTLMLPVLSEAANRPVRMPEVAERIACNLGLTDEEQEELLPSGRQKLFYNRLAWAKFHMSKAGLLDVPSRGLFVANDAGRALLATHPARIDMEKLREFPTYASFIASTTTTSPAVDAATDAAASSEVTPEEQIEAANNILHAVVKGDLLQRLLDSSPAFFERVIVDLVVAMGYGGSHDDAAQRLGKTGDGGIDGVIDEDRLGLDRIYLQAKRYTPDESVGRPAIQGFVGSLVGFGAAKGIFVTTSSFSRPAIEYVRHLPQRVVLIDGDRLCELMIEYGVGSKVSRTIMIKRIDEDYFADE
jgi:restriction system protein